MTRTVIFIPTGNPSIVNIEGTRQILSWVNSYCRSKGRGAIFDIQLMRPVLGEVHDFFSQAKPIGKGENPDLVIIPAVHGPWEQVRSQNQELISWIRKVYSE